MTGYQLLRYSDLEPCRACGSPQVAVKVTVRTFDVYWRSAANRLGPRFQPLQRIWDRLGATLHPRMKKSYKPLRYHSTLRRSVSDPSSLPVRVLLVVSWLMWQECEDNWGKLQEPGRLEILDTTQVAFTIGGRTCLCELTPRCRHHEEDQLTSGVDIALIALCVPYDASTQSGRTHSSSLNYRTSFI